MEPEKNDTNLLFGILAMKMNFIRPEDLLEAMGIWFLDRQKTLGEILTERRAISPQDCQLLDSMVRESQARQGQHARPNGQDRQKGPAKPLESIGADWAWAGRPGWAHDGSRSVDGQRINDRLVGLPAWTRQRALCPGSPARQGGNRQSLGRPRSAVEPRGRPQRAAGGSRHEAREPGAIPAGSRGDGAARAPWNCSRLRHRLDGIG